MRLLAVDSNLTRVCKRAGVTAATATTWSNAKRAAPEIELLRNLMDAGGLDIVGVYQLLPEGWGTKNHILKTYIMIEREVQREEQHFSLEPQMINADLE